MSRLAPPRPRPAPKGVFVHANGAYGSCPISHLPFPLPTIVQKKKSFVCVPAWYATSMQQHQQQQQKKKKNIHLKREEGSTKTDRGNFPRYSSRSTADSSFFCSSPTRNPQRDIQQPPSAVYTVPHTWYTKCGGISNAESYCTAHEHYYSTIG